MHRLSRVKFSNLDKILYPELGLKKADIIEYYIKIAPSLLPHLKNRAIVRKRYPNGVNEEGFYEKDIPKGTPTWIETFTKYTQSTNKDTIYVVCNDLDTLVWLSNLAALELHIPLSNIKVDNEPDLLLFDIDPEPPANIRETVQATMLLYDYLESLGLKPFVKTSGKKGLHVVVHLESGYSFKDTSFFTHAVAIELARKYDFIVSERSQTKIPGTVLIDYPQNSARGTMIAPYSLRAVREATVSTPLEWGELQELRPYDWNIFNVADRNNKPWKDLFGERFTIPI